MITTTDPLVLRRLKLLIEKWGGKLTELSEDHYDRFKTLRGKGFSEAPFTHRMLGVTWGAKGIFYSGELYWTELIHEMGHVFASLKTPDMSDEFDFFGWEAALVRHVRAPLSMWVKANEIYSVTDNGTELGSLSPKEVRELLHERRAFARANHLLDEKNRPLPLR